MPLDPKIEQFVADNPQGVLTTYRKNGRAQMSIVTVRPHRDGIGISITETRSKFHNLVRTPACSLLISAADWWSGFIVVDGDAEMIHSGNTDPETLRLARPRYTAPPPGAAHPTGTNTTILSTPISVWL